MQQQHREAPWYRSMLFVPGHKLDWMLKAPRYGADALIFDLEDSVPIDSKPDARVAVQSALDQLKGQPFGRFVRLNSWRMGNTLQDVLGVFGPGLDGVMLAKAEDTEDVTALDLVLTDLEIQHGLEVGHVEIIALCETALAMHRHFEICQSSQRIRRSHGAGSSVAGADIARATGLRLNDDEGIEGLMIHAREGLEARAAGITQIYGGMTSKIDDLGLVRRMAERAKALGSNGSLCIHPSHVAILNEVFSPSAAELAEAQGVLHAMVDAVAAGSAAVKYNGAMVDYAHVRTALELLHQAKSVGIEVGEIPELPVLSFDGAR